MTTLIIGGDRIDSIRRELVEHGLNSIEHWSGRKPADARRVIPSRVKLVVMVTDQLSHPMLYNATIHATKLGLPIIYSSRSARDLAAKLAERFGKKKTAPEKPNWTTPLGFFAITY